jgi:hypothetical protein
MNHSCSSSVTCPRNARPRATAVPLMAAAALAMLLAGRVHATTTVTVYTEPELQSALATANSSGGGTTILLADGTYTLTSTLYVTAPNVTIAGASGDRTKAIIQGDAMSSTAQIGDVIRVAASNFTLHDVTLQRSGWHLIQIAGETNAQAPVIRNCILRDSYEQMLKVSDDPVNAPGVYSNNGIVENCIFEYSAGIGPEYYIGGIDAHGSKNWTVTGNQFIDIISPSTTVAEFAVHFWDNSADNTVERNLIINCDRGIGFGLDNSTNTGGIIRNNMIYHAANMGQFADVAVALTDSPNTQVYDNTAYMLNNLGWSMEYRYTATTNVLFVNNLTNQPIISRDGGTGTVNNNVTTAVASWFVAPSSGDLHLAYAVPGVVGAGVPVAGLTDDYDGQPRPSGSGIDIGADQYSPGPTPNPPGNLQVQ